MRLMDTLLPFEWLHYTFWKNALIAIVLLTPAVRHAGHDGGGIIRWQPFFSDALGQQRADGHRHRRGARWQSHERDAVRHSVGGAYHVCEASFQDDADLKIISVFSSTSIALYRGNSRGGAFAKYSSVLVGRRAFRGAICWLLVGRWPAQSSAGFSPCLTRCSFHGVNAPLAQSRGIRSRMTEYAFTILVAVAVMVSIRWVGVMLINSLLILPAAASATLRAARRGICARA